MLLGHVSYALDDLASYQGMNRWHDHVLEDERQGLPRWIRHWSDRLRAECAGVGERYIDVGELGFDRAMVAAERSLRRTGLPVTDEHLPDACAGKKQTSAVGVAARGAP